MEPFSSSLLTLALAMAAMGTAPGRSTLACRLDAAGPAHAGGPVPIRFTVSNAGKRGVFVLEWHTPLEGLLADVLDARDSRGRRLPYNGPVVKRADPEAGEYVRIGPGKSAMAEIDASLAYDFAEPGSYVIRFTRGLMDVAPAGAVPRRRGGLRPLALECPPLQIEVGPKAAPLGDR